MKKIIAIIGLWGCVVLGGNAFGAADRQGLHAEFYDKVTNDGAWCWFSDPRAIYVDGKVVGGFVDSEGSIWAFQYNPTTQEKVQHKLFDKLDQDDHANPSVMALKDGRIALFFSAHGGTTNSPLYYAITKKAGDITQWGDLLSFNPSVEGRYGVCYTNPAMLSGEKGRVYMFFRGGDFKPTYAFSDDLIHWSEPKTLIVNDPEYGDYGRPYTKMANNGKDKVFVAFTDAHPRNRADNSIYYMQYRKGKVYGADGRVISADFSKPVTPSMTDKVYDAAKTMDKAWIWDVAYDEKENPVIVYARISHATAQHSYWYARWDGSKWENSLITKAGQWFQRADYKKEAPEYENNYSGGVYLDHSNPNIVYTSRPIDDVFEIERWTRGGDGKFACQAVTKQSDRDNVRPFVVRGDNGVKGQLNHVLWMYNYKYPHFKQYQCALRINEPTKGFSSAFDRAKVEQVANAVFDWQIADYKRNQWPDNEQRGWRTGVLYNGMFDWAEQTNNEDYFKFMRSIYARQYWQVGNRMYHADELCVSQVYLDMYKRYGKEEMWIPTKARIDWIIANPPSENIDITKGRSDRWWWCDALFMAPAVFTRLYAITGDEKYINFAHKEFLATYDHLYDKQERLFFRDAKYIGVSEANGKKIFWSRGNGWVMGGLVEVLKSLPKDELKYRPYYVSLFEQMCQRIAQLQSQDGYWRSSMLDPQTYTTPETSGTALFVFAMAYGINEGLLDKKEYLPVVEKGWKALVEAVDTEGKLGWVQLVAQKPGAGSIKDNEVYGVGGFLMAASEIHKMLH